MITRLLFFFCFLLCTLSGWSQIVLPATPDPLFSTYYHQRVSHFGSLPASAKDIVFLGNSITDGAEWVELFTDNRLKNRGISGDVSAGILHRLPQIAAGKPAKIFLLIGTNDLARNIPADSLLKNIYRIAAYLRQETPLTKLFVQSILPVNTAFNKFARHTNKGDQIRKVNAQLQQNALANHYTFIDLFAAFANEKGELAATFTNDGLHLTGKGYTLWKHLVYPYVFGVESRPALIPVPQKTQWLPGYFSLLAGKTIVVKGKTLKPEAEQLRQLLGAKGISVKIIEEAKGNEPFIELRLGKINAPQYPEEAYQLEVTAKKVVLTANTAHGIFNGIQTLSQLIRDNVLVDACLITDWPAFSWRGYMVDVGRNFQSVALLKQQIDKMAQYKLNIFHFHLTEDIAWRLQIPKYPQLTAPEHMLRNKGAYYSVSEMKDLIQYCRDRYITLVPEIDVPGHSAAFVRAMGVEMQSPEGLALVKEILTDVCQTYDVPYIHLGGDEVKITNPDFLPAVTSLLHRLGKKTIGWEPGGNLADNTIRQLWMTEGPRQPNLKYIDSRHLYINHMDPLESVITIYNRQLGDAIQGTEQVLGATFCVWHDRNVLKEEDVLHMNPVYPAMLAFAERSWQGGGYSGWITNIKSSASQQLQVFKDFEKRLLEHQKLYFASLPFSYAAQSELKWELLGPFKNGGDVAQVFAPEKKGFKPENSPFTAVGGTVVLRHFWHPLVTGVLENPEENTTWYAYTRFWSDVSTTKKFWIGFNNLSRSYNSNSPVEGTWDNRGSAVFLNNQLLTPPQWQRAGQKGNGEAPLLDEGYEYRAPITAPVHKGWNKILVKLPVKSFKGSDWQNPVKWMFTVVPLSEE
ncbi:family 20 glycosylhydrolase [Adhaeribacter swui]|uniref:beta-N-acetylhexosaminidase n=1 Tax=Adhaeribacter swui TaxID=2086471 RepID=A0A7G7G548_9BACT|nr:family 20 glycosylhydrolase [Adhaeribacter swui]QNF32282.1 family 20 glycosylhydrolase [Adhaeribacter swui]